LVGSEWIIFF